MSSISEEIKACYGCHERNDDELLHYGMKFRSGRYPYGSGEEPYQHSRDFLGRIKQLKNENFTYTDEDGKTWTGDNAIAKSMGLTSSEYRKQVSWANYERRLNQVETAKSLREDGLGATEIGRKMGIPESTVRSLLEPKSENKMHQAMETASFLKEQLDQKGMIDVGTGVEKELGISRERLNLALDYLTKVEDCPVYGGGIPQINNKNQQTNQLVLCQPGTKSNAIYEFDKVHSVNEYASKDGGQTFEKFQYPTSISSKRVKVLLRDEVGPDGETGVDKDGIIQIRRGVDDLSLGCDNYSQVRILVDGDKYLKGMAVYSDNIPDGYDIIFNSNKTSIDKALKKIGVDPDNPFGTTISPKGQSTYIDKNGKERLSAINKVRGEGEWDEWSNALPSQFLAKQSKALAKKQLDLARLDKMDEFNDICALNNPTIKKYLLEKFADECDSSAVHLKAAALPGQKYHVIIPINTLKDTEVYAPGYPDGTKLALIRYPHGGTFEIPICTVNNKNKTANNVIGKQAIDAIGINAKVAEQLSGADFDGDTVMCIPTHDRQGRVKITNQKPLKQLEGFDTRLEYGGEERLDANGNVHYYRNGHEYPIMKATGLEMGKISNLITDMTLGGANTDELARAVKHSMVVIDAEKHKLDYKASEKENDIAALKQKYQIKVDDDGNPTGKFGGAGTLLSRSKGEYTIDKRQGSYKTNVKGTEDYDPTRPEGAKIWKTADDLWYPIRQFDKKTGIVTLRTSDGKKISYDSKDPESKEKYEPVPHKNETTGEVTFTNRAGDITYRGKKRTQESTNMAETDDAYTLLSAQKYDMEILYADYANDMKALANKARLEMVSSGKIAYNPTAKKEYAEEVKSLMDKLNTAQLNAPKERAAQRSANAELKRKTADNPDMTGEEKRKAGQQALNKYRADYGTVSRRDRNIDITDREWEAIQKGAITETKLQSILNNADIDKLRERATPKTKNTISDVKIKRMKALADSNHTLSEIAQKLGVSTSVVSQYLKGKE